MVDIASRLDLFSKYITTKNILHRPLSLICRIYELGFVRLGLTFRASSMINAASTSHHSSHHG